MKLETPHIIIGIAIIAIVLGAYFMTDTTEDEISNLAISIGNVEVKEKDMSWISPLYVFMSGNEAGDEIHVEPGESIDFNVRVWNDRDTTHEYKVWVYDEYGRMIFTSPDAYLMPGDIEVWDFVYTAYETPGTTLMIVESGYKLAPISTTYEFDSYFYFDVIVDPEATPTPTPTATATETPTEEPTEEPTPDPCEGMPCDAYCDGTTYRYNGYCDDGECMYQTELNSAQCPASTGTGTGTGTPTATPTGTGTPDPDPDPDGDMSGILWYGGGIIGVMLVLLLALRAKK